MNRNLPDDSIPTGDTRRYKRGKTIAKTLFGKVRYGKDYVTNDWIVIKESKRANVKSQTTDDGHHVAENLLKEIDIHKSLSKVDPKCPYIIDLLDVCSDDVNIYMILEYAHSGDLFQYVAVNMQQLLTLGNTAEREVLVQKWQKTAAKIFVQLAIAVKFLFKQAVCHRDLSLENVMLDQEHSAKVIDFGVAEKYKDGVFKLMTQRVGKTGYMSPEIYKGKAYDARKNDIWCLGVILFMMLVGNPPWECPHERDKRFKYCMKGKANIADLIKRWRRSYLVNDEGIDLLSRIFTVEENRIDIDGILSHPYCKKYSDVKVEITPEPGIKPTIQQKSQKSVKDDSKSEVDSRSGDPSKAASAAVEKIKEPKSMPESQLGEQKSEGEKRINMLEQRLDSIFKGTKSEGEPTSRVRGGSHGSSPSEVTSIKRSQSDVILSTTMPNRNYLFDLSHSDGTVSPSKVVYSHLDQILSLGYDLPNGVNTFEPLLIDAMKRVDPSVSQDVLPTLPGYRKLSRWWTRWKVKREFLDGIIFENEGVVNVEVEGGANRIFYLPMHKLNFQRFSDQHPLDKFDGRIRNGDGEFVELDAWGNLNRGEYTIRLRETRRLNGPIRGLLMASAKE